MPMYKMFVGGEGTSDAMCLLLLQMRVKNVSTPDTLDVRATPMFVDLLTVLKRVENRLQDVEVQTEALANNAFASELCLRAKGARDEKAMRGATDDGGLRRPLKVCVKSRVAQEAMQYVDASYKKGILTWLEDNAYVMSRDHSDCSDLYVAVDGGAVCVSVGSWIVKGVHGELNVLSEEMFEDVYEIVK